MVAGHDVTRELEAVKDRIGYMAQRFGLYQDLTVSENMEFYADLFGITGAERDRLMPSAANDDAHGAVQGSVGRPPVGRDEAETRAHVHAPAQTRGAVSR